MEYEELVKELLTNANCQITMEENTNVIVLSSTDFSKNDFKSDYAPVISGRAIVYLFDPVKDAQEFIEKLNGDTPIIRSVLLS